MYSIIPLDKEARKITRWRGHSFIYGFSVAFFVGRAFGKRLKEAKDPKNRFAPGIVVENWEIWVYVFFTIFPALIGWIGVHITGRTEKMRLPKSHGDKRT